MARVILDDYRAHDQLQEAFEESFYAHEQKSFIPLRLRLCSRQAEEATTKAEARMLTIAKFLVGQGADVAARNSDNQTPADIALSQCGASLLHQYLRHVEDGIDGAEEVSNLNEAEDNALSESRPPVLLTKSGKGDVSRVLHGRSPLPKPPSWSMPLFLLASLVFLLCLVTKTNRRATGEAARIVRCYAKFRWVPFSIFCLCWWWYSKSFQIPTFLEPIRTMLLSWLPRWFLQFGLCMSCLAVAFEDRAAEAKDKLWSACSVLCLRVKQWCDGRNPQNNLAAEAIARQGEDRGTPKKEKQ